jgi:hypothetical protein
MIRTVAVAIFALFITAEPAQADDFTLQTKCADAARQYFHENKAQLGEGQNTHFENHYSIALQKCFIRISVGPDYTQSPVGFIMIFVFDAVEGKEYGEFNGYSFCHGNDQDNHCYLNSGSMWFDGNPQRNPPDLQLGFGGVVSGKIGSATTESEFIAATDKYFMAN